MGWSFEVHNRKRASKSGAVTRNPSTSLARPSAYERGGWERPAGARALCAVAAFLGVTLWKSNKRRSCHRSGRRGRSSYHSIVSDVRDTVSSQVSALGGLKSFVEAKCRHGLELARRARRGNHDPCPPVGSRAAVDDAYDAVRSRSGLSSSAGQQATSAPTAEDAAGSPLGAVDSGVIEEEQQSAVADDVRASPARQAPLLSNQQQPKFLDAAAEDATVPAAPRPSKSTAKRNKRKGRRSKH